MLVDDPVKRVDNMTMARDWARVPSSTTGGGAAAACPPALKLARGGKGVCSGGGAGVAVIADQGYFPVPAIRHLEVRS
jgi:asparagine synthase (glutamine-hydrolysing)